jgi:hypothetical protein
VQKHFPALDIEQIGGDLFLRPLRVRKQCADILALYDRMLRFAELR